MMISTPVITQCSCGLPGLMLDGRHVHSPRDPQREAARLAGTVPANTHCVIVFGFGLGYLPEALIARFAPNDSRDTDETVRIIVLEADPAILELARKTRQLETLLAHPSLSILLPGDEDRLPPLVEDNGRVPIVLKNAALVLWRPEWYAKQEELIALIGRRARTNEATKAKFARRWIRNTVMNADMTVDVPGIRYLYRAFEGLPALLVAAGPSLDRYRELLPILRERCVIVCVDTALRSCVSSGCTPDFVLAVDPQYWNARHLDHVDTSQCTLVSELALWPALWRLPWREAYLFSSLFPLGAWLEKRTDLKGALAAGGSVATSAWDFCRYLGCRDIQVMGLDLAYPAGRTHMRGAAFEEYSLMRSRRLHPAELDSFLVPRSALAERVPARGGGTVLCDARMKMYAAWFSRACTQDSRYRTRSLGCAGAAIEGIDCLESDELLNMPTIRDEIETRRTGRHALMQEERAASRETRQCAFENALTVLMGQLQLLRNACEKAAVSCGRALQANLPLGESTQCTDREGESLVKKALTACEKAQELVGREEIKDVAGFLFPSSDTIDRAMSESADNKLRYHLAWSMALWQELGASARWQDNLLRKKFKVSEEEVDT